MILKQEFIAYDGDSLQFIANWLADASCDISETLGYDANKFKIIVSIENIENKEQQC